MTRRALPLAWILVALALVPPSAAAQQSTAPQMVTVDGKPMRIWAAGLDTRKPGQPVIVLESGAGS